MVPAECQFFVNYLSLNNVHIDVAIRFCTNKLTVKLRTFSVLATGSGGGDLPAFREIEIRRRQNFTFHLDEKRGKSREKRHYASGVHFGSVSVYRLIRSSVNLSFALIMFRDKRETDRNQSLDNATAERIITGSASIACELDTKVPSTLRSCDSHQACFTSV